LLHEEEEDDHNHKDEKKEDGAEDRYSSEPQRTHPTGEFVIVAKFGGHVLHHLASRLVNVIRAERQNKNQFLKNPYLSFYNCYNVLCTISGVSSIN